MLKEEAGGGGGGGNRWARACDTCRATACAVYCRADSAYLCAGCDAQVHAANRVASQHQRVWVCEACEQAPAAFLCKADSASLCAACDADIHSANPLARRHQRVPILPTSGCLYGPQVGDETVGEEDEDEAASWLLPNPEKNGRNNQNNNNNGFLIGGEIDEYFDLVEYNSDQNQYSSEQYTQQLAQKSGHGGDSVVPIQCGEVKDQLQQQQHQYQNFKLGFENESSKSAYSYNSSTSHSVSVSPMDVGVVPESTISEISISNSRPPKWTIDFFSGPTIQMPSQLSPTDREARVLRYREKKKTRKFEKTIRYASRKAYAETRPRIKGRFAKKTDMELEVDQIFSISLMAETGYCIVPSFKI